LQTILIAEDNEDLRGMLGQFLDANGYRTVGAAAAST
jgi:DNA-binding response OmpR family regulator